MKQIKLNLLTLAAALCLLAIPVLAATPTAIGPLKVFSENGSVALRSPGWTDALVLTANTAKTYTLPTASLGGGFVFFSASCSYYVANNGSPATVPGADVTTGVASELNPAVRWYPASQGTISVISPVACVVTMNIYTQ